MEDFCSFVTSLGKYVENKGYWRVQINVVVKPLVDISLRGNELKFATSLLESMKSVISSRSNSLRKKFRVLFWRLEDRDRAGVIVVSGIELICRCDG